MKYVLHVMGMDSTKYGGIERYNVRLSEALYKEGYLSIFVYESFPETATFVKDLQKFHASIYISNSRKHPIQFCLVLAKLINKYHPEIMHAHFTKARFYAIPIAVLMGIKKIYFTIHSSLGVKTQIKLLTRLWYSWANSVSKVIVVSENIAVMYKSNWPNAQVRRIYLGVDHSPLDRNESRQLLGIPNQQLMLLTVANFNYIKGLDYLIKSIAYLKSKDMWLDKAHLYIVGQTEKDKQELNTLIKSLELEDDVTLVGISNCVAEFMASADLYIQPSRSEGLPLALMEASSFSLPLIGCNVGGIPEIIVDGYNGFLTESENESQLANKISMLLADNCLRMVFGENSYNIYKMFFSLEQSISHTISFYLS